MHVFPTRDLHLILAAGLDDEMHLSMFEDRPPPASPSWRDLSIEPGFMLTAIVAADAVGPAVASVRGLSDPPAPGDSPTGLSFRPIAAGNQFYEVSVIEAAVSRTFVLRVSVHPDIERIWTAQPTITVLAGERNHVLTVFAQFAPGERWDVTEHPYLDYSSDDTAVATIANGRIHGLVAGMSTTLRVWIRGRAATTTQTCTVQVVAAAARYAAGEIEVRLLNAPRGATQRCFVLSEGYADRAAFTEHAKKVVEQWLRGEANSPFRYVSDQFRVVSIFDAVPARGIAVACPLAVWSEDPDQSVPLTMAQVSGVIGTIRYQPVRDTRFGLMYGARLGDPQASEITGDGIDHLGEEWLRPNGVYVGAAPWGQPVRVDRSITVDHRRLPPRRDGAAVLDPREEFTAFLRRYLLALGFTATDEDRFVFLVDDQFRGGARLSIAGLEPEVNRRVAITSTGDDAGFDNWATVADSPFLSRNPIRRTFHAGWVGSSMVHELGHTYGLGDEYEWKRKTVTATAQGRANLLGYDNLQLRADVFTFGNEIAVERIKWIADRVDKASRITIATRVPGAPGFYDLMVAGEPRGLWKVDETAVMRTTYGAPPESPDPQVPRLIERLVTVIEVTDLVVSVYDPSSLPFDEAILGAHGVLYAPRRIGTNRVTLIEPAVIDYLRATDQIFSKPHDCASTDPKAGDEEVRPPTIPGLKMPSRPADLIGLYEGGYDVACGVVRPSGRCKMRRNAVYDPKSSTVKEVWPFCFVCKFIVLDRIDPGQHARLDDEYPRDC